jgi:excisionase family DNA binding protein
MPKDKKQAEYYTAKELAEKLSLNVMTIYRYIDAGKLKAYKIGKEFRIDKAEFERFMNKAKTK